MPRSTTAFFLVTATIIGAACGGIAVVDEPLANDGAGGTGSGIPGNPVCVTTDPVGSLTECGTTVTSGGSCASTVCDQGNNTWESECEATTCICRFNGEIACSCALAEPGQFCSANTPSCCPPPFPG